MRRYPEANVAHCMLDALSAGVRFGLCAGVIVGGSVLHYFGPHAAALLAGVSLFFTARPLAQAKAAMRGRV